MASISPELNTEQPCLIALDWGTSSLRAYLVGCDGVVMAKEEKPLGILRVPGGDFARVFEETTSQWRNAYPGLPTLACGMIGSTIGWHEVPYASCPAGLDDLARALRYVPGKQLAVIPGIRQDNPADVMRGEETQIVGALALSDLSDGLFVLPGTHSKWVDVRDGRIFHFATYMTGELFDCLSKHSVLGRMATTPKGGEAGAEISVGAAAAVRDAGHAAPLLFGARAKALTGQLDPAFTLDYLSGLLIGEELVSALSNVPRNMPITLIGSPSHCNLYANVLACFNRQAHVAPASTTATGLWQIAVAAGLLPKDVKT